MNEINKCVLCNANLSKSDFSNGVYYNECPICGNYFIEKNDMYYLGQVLGRVLYHNQLYFNSTEKDKELNILRNQISSYVYILNKKNSGEFIYPTINEESIRILFNSKEIPITPEEKVDTILNSINNKTEVFGSYVDIKPIEVFLSGNNELNAFIKELLLQKLISVKQQDRVYIETIEHSEIWHGNRPFDNQYGIPHYIPLNLNLPYAVSLTLNGIGYIKAKKTEQRKDECFVAMWFNPEMNDVYEKCIMPACLGAGYRPIRVDNEQFNGDITDKIIASIRTTHFTIADLTGYRGGVYYEAGFAKGLGKEVILTCRNDWFDGDPKENRRVHFDVNHLSIIVWDNSDKESLKQMLKERIIATVGQGTYLVDNGN